MPKCKEDVDGLFLQMKKLDDNKKQLNDLLKLIKEQEEQINSVLLSYTEQQLLENPDFKHKSDIGTIQKRKQSSWKYIDEKSIIRQLKAIDPSLVSTALVVASPNNFKMFNYCKESKAYNKKGFL